MKIGKIHFIALAVVFFIVNFGPVTAYAQDMTIWVGKWFKLTNSNTEYCFDPEQIIHPDRYTFTSYLKIWSWDSDNKVFLADGYSSDVDHWEIIPFNLNYFGGSYLDFLFSSQGIMLDTSYGFIGRITGKTKEDVLKSAKFDTPALYSVGSHCVSGGKITGILIPESKVPVPSEIIVH